MSSQTLNERIVKIIFVTVIQHYLGSPANWPLITSCSRITTWARIIKNILPNEPLVPVTAAYNRVYRVCFARLVPLSIA